MKATEVLARTMGMGHQLASMMFDDVRDAPLTQPTPKGGNHPLWVAGHLAWAEGGMFQLITGEANPCEDWKPLFGGGTEPVADSSKYPPFADVAAKFLSLREANIKALARMSDADLDKQVPMFGTLGQAFSDVSMHATMHLGQVADARRVLGRKPFFSGPPEA